MANHQGQPGVRLTMIYERAAYEWPLHATGPFGKRRGPPATLMEKNSLRPRSPNQLSPSAGSITGNDVLNNVNTRPESYD